MPTDEQRECFEVFLATWFDVYDRAMLAPKELSSLKAAYEAGHRSRDAEVQALREALERLSDGYWRLAEEAKPHLDTSPDVDLIAETTALLRGEEVSEDE